MQIIRDAVVFAAKLPSFDNLLENLKEFPFHPVPESLISSAGFVPHKTTGEILTPYPGGYFFCLRYDSKTLKTSTVARLIEERIDAEIQEDGEEAVDKARRNEIRDEVRAELIKRAVPDSIIISGFYHIESEYLVVPTTSKDLAQVLVRSLIKACGSVKTETIHVDDIKGGLTTRLRNYIDGLATDDEEMKEIAFGDFKPGSACWLKGESGKATFDMNDLDVARFGISEALGNMMSVEKMELVYERVWFRLTKDFRLNKIEFIPGEDSTDFEREDGEGDDAAYQYRMEVGVQMVQLQALIKALCDLFGYRPPEQGDKSTAEAAAAARKLDGWEAPLLPSPADDAEDPLYADAVDFVMKSKRASISAVQRKLKIGYNRAARMIERMESDGHITAADSHGGREVIEKKLLD